MVLIARDCRCGWRIPRNLFRKNALQDGCIGKAYSAPKNSKFESDIESGALTKVPPALAAACMQLLKRREGPLTASHPSCQTACASCSATFHMNSAVKNELGGLVRQALDAPGSWSYVQCALSLVSTFPQRKCATLALQRLSKFHTGYACRH